MKFLILLLAIIAFSNCEDLQVLVENFEAKINSLLAAKNFDGLLEYLEKPLNFLVNKGEVKGESREDFINYLKNGTFVMFNGVGSKDVPHVQKANELIEVHRNLANGYLTYLLRNKNETEFGYLMASYSGV